jgi:hypothetical protein
MRWIGVVSAVSGAAGVAVLAQQATVMNLLRAHAPGVAQQLGNYCVFLLYAGLFAGLTGGLALGAGVMAIVGGARVKDSRSVWFGIVGLILGINLALSAVKLLLGPSLLGSSCE